MSHKEDRSLRNFFTSEVRLALHPNQKKGEIFWESRESGWLYPWRITRVLKTRAYGYPCGEPKREC